MRIPNHNEQRLGTSDSHVKPLGITQETNTVTYINTNQWLVRTNLQPITTQQIVRVNSLTRLHVVNLVSVHHNASSVRHIRRGAFACRTRWFDRKRWWFTLKWHALKTFSETVILENGVLSVWKRKRSIVDRIMWTTGEHTWMDRRTHMDGRAHQRKHCNVDGAFNSKYTTVWSKSHFWQIFENASKESLVLIIRQKSESIRQNKLSESMVQQTNTSLRKLWDAGYRLKRLKQFKLQGQHNGNGVGHFKGATSLFAHPGKFILNFSNSTFVIRVNLLHP